MSRATQGMRGVACAMVMLLLTACGGADEVPDPLPRVGPFAAIDSVSLGTTAERVLAVRERAVRAPMGGVREPMGDWMVHYDLPTPRVDTLFSTMRVRELSALRGMPDSATAQQLQDSLLDAIRASGAPFTGRVPKCTRTKRGVDSVTWVVLADNTRELVLGYWVNRLTSPADTAPPRDSAPRRITPPLMLAMTLRSAAEPRAWEREVACPASARD